MLILLFLCENLSAQEVLGNKTYHSKRDSQHSIITEVGGRTFAFGSLSYEYAITNRFSLGTGIGMGRLESGEITGGGGFGSFQRTRNILKTELAQMMYGNYFIGKNKHKLLLSLGLTNCVIFETSKELGNRETSMDLQLKWNVGCGYQFSKNRVSLRFMAYYLQMFEGIGYTYDYLPWAGISVGFKI